MPPLQEFPGRNIDEMLSILAANKMPASIADIARAKVDGSWLMDRYADTGMVALYGTNGNVKIGYGTREFFEMIKPKAKLSNGALVLSEEFYEQYKGREFTRNDLKNYNRRFNSSEAVCADPIWQLFIDDPTLLEQFAEKTFSHVFNKYNERTAMGVWFGNTPKVHAGRLWCLGYYGYSNANGYYHLDNDNGRLVRVVAPEAQVSLENTAVGGRAKSPYREGPMVPLQDVLTVIEKYHGEKTLPLVQEELRNLVK